MTITGKILLTVFMCCGGVIIASTSCCDNAYSLKEKDKYITIAAVAVVIAFFDILVAIWLLA